MSIPNPSSSNRNEIPPWLKVVEMDPWSDAGLAAAYLTREDLTNLTPQEMMITTIKGSRADYERSQVYVGDTVLRDFANLDRSIPLPKGSGYAWDEDKIQVIHTHSTYKYPLKGGGASDSDYELSESEDELMTEAEAEAEAVARLIYPAGGQVLSLLETKVAKLRAGVNKREAMAPTTLMPESTRMLSEVETGVAKLEIDDNKRKAELSHLETELARARGFLKKLAIEVGEARAESKSKAKAKAERGGGRSTVSHGGESGKQVRFWG